MSEKQIDVECPCCGALLAVDVRTARVLRSARPREVDETGKPVLDEGRWDDANRRVAERSGGSEEVFDAALRKEHGRSKDLDELFDKAKRKLDRRADDGP